MKVKISVSKLHKMEMRSKLRLDAAYHALQKEEESNKEYRDEVATYREKVAEMFNDRHDFKEKLTEAEQTINYLTDENDALKEKVEDLKSEDNDVQAFQLERKEQLVTQAETIKYLTEHNDVLKKQVKTLDNRLIHANTLEEKSRAAWIELHGKKIDLEIQCKALDEQCEALKQEVEDLKKDRDDWEDAARSAADNL